MRLFLASYRFGAHRDRLLAMVGAPGRVAVIANAADAWPAAARSSAVTSDLVPLRRLGFDPFELDLRDYAGRISALPEVLGSVGFVWVRGGNTFVLRAQFARCGADRVLPELLATDALVYAGYSAGACLLTPSLRGLEAADDPAEVLTTCGVQPIWDGLGLVDRPIVPHCGSDPDADAIVARYRRDRVAHWALSDEQVVVVEGERVEVVQL
ncbi:MAG TPA: Type 1 glutamine amidotransferase-like domain-containing protein [Aldersonia sp.]